MRILLLGEYSAFYKNLKEGLLELGQEVKLYANGDEWKKIGGADGRLYGNADGGGRLSKIKHYLMEPYKNLPLFKDYDMVQIINPLIYNNLINTDMIKKIKRQNHKLYLSAAGNDYYLQKIYKEGAFRYYMFDDNPLDLARYSENTRRGRQNIKSDRAVVNMVHGIIPITYETMIPYKKSAKRKPVILLPVNLKQIEYKENRPKDRIVFFHGLNREHSKGTPYIREAMERVAVKYPNDIEIIIKGNMPLQEYLTVMEKANVVIDQCKCYGYGMNAVLAMAQGKIVFSGCEPEILKMLGTKSAPVINIRPDPNSIAEEMERIIENRKRITEQGFESRKFVEDRHSHVQIAQQYLDCWRQA